MNALTQKKTQAIMAIMLQNLDRMHHLSQIENFASTHLCRIFHLLEALMIQGWTCTKLLTVALDFAPSEGLQFKGQSF